MTKLKSFLVSILKLEMFGFTLQITPLGIINTILYNRLFIRTLWWLCQLAWEKLLLQQLWCTISTGGTLRGRWFLWHPQNLWLHSKLKLVLISWGFHNLIQLRWQVRATQRRFYYRWQNELRHSAQSWAFLRFTNFKRRKCSFSSPICSMRWCADVRATYRKQQAPQLWMEGTGERCRFFCSPKFPYLSAMSQQFCHQLYTSRFDTGHFDPSF